MQRLPRQPSVSFKTAHAVNWLVSDRGTITMIDLEAGARVPIWLDVAELLEDQPFLPVDGAGWSARLELCETYADTLATCTDSAARLPPVVSS